MIASARPAARIDSRIGTRRKHPAVAEAALVAHQQEIDVATQAQMLKAVVENHRVERAELAQQLDAIEAPSRNRDRTAERLRHHGRFVARIFQRDFQHASISHQLGGLFRSRSSVAAAHDSDAETVALQAPREKQCERRLAGSTDRQIADAHCQHRSLAFHHPPVQPAARPRRFGRSPQRPPVRPTPGAGEVEDPDPTIVRFADGADSGRWGASVSRD